MRTDPVRIGFSIGLLFAFFHTGWAALVALGWAQPVLDFMIWAHFLRLPVQVESFDLHQASILIGATAIIGFGLGVLLGLVWNVLHPKGK